MEGVLHTYHPTRSLLLFEHTPKPSSSEPISTSQPPNVLLFIGGLYDKFLAPGYTVDLARLFPRHMNQKWSVMHVQLSSAGRSWGMFDLNRDIEEIAAAVNFIHSDLIKDERASVVVMGHSTGCQDALHYLCSPNPASSGQSSKPSPPRPQIQGAILQAPVSDREAALYHASKDSQAMTSYESAVTICKATAEVEHRNTFLPMNLTAPLFGPTPVSVARFLSLVSPDSPARPSIDDLFSSDLSDERLKSTFGAVASRGLLAPVSHNLARFSTPSMLVLISGADENVPAHVDTSALLGRWRAAMSGTGVALNYASRLIPHATHDVSGSDEKSMTARLVDLREDVLRYLDLMVGGVDETAWKIWEQERAALSPGSKI